MLFGKRPQIAIATCSSLLAFVCSSTAATLTWSVDAPVIDGADVANYAGATNQEGNILAGDDAGTFIAADRPAQGQIFTTTGATGQVLHAVTFQHVVGEGTWWSLDSGWTGYNGGRFFVLVGTIANGTFTPLRGTQTYMNDDIPNAGSQNGVGTGMYATVTFDNPLPLNPNTEYAIAWTVTADSNIVDAPYWEVNGDGTTSDNYVAGEAFTLTGTLKDQNQTYAVQSLVGDRVFHADITGELPEWAGLPIDGNGWVDTGDWMGHLYVVEDPWIYSANLESWVYLPGETISENGAWSYVPAQ